MANEGRRAVSDDLMSRRPALAFARAMLLLSILLCSVLVVRTTGLYTRKSQELAENALESTALALSATAESVLRAGGVGREADFRSAFSDRIVAYALIASPEGKVLFHTNRALVGTTLPGWKPIDWGRRQGVSFGHRVTLGTGLPAYEFNHLVRSEGGGETLRIVLHTTESDAIATRGRTMRESVGGMLALLWLSGILMERLLARQFRLREEAERREALALIGQMTATLAHEIRNAIGSVKGFAQWVDEKTESRDPRKKGLDAILQGTSRIEGLVEELLLYSREESYAMASVDPAEIAEAAIRDAASQWNGRIVRDPGEGIRVAADPEILRRVLANGVRNAIEAMGEGGLLAVSVRRSGGSGVIRIEDSGPGIPASARALLFTPFFTTKPDGTGLGLAYSRKVVEGMGGSIELANREDGIGAALVVRLKRTDLQG